MTHPLRDMYELHESGATLQQVGERFGLSGSYVGYLFKEAGLKVHLHHPAHPVAEMYALYETGASLREVGERFGLSRPEVGHIFRRAGLKVRPASETRTLRPKHPVAEMYAFYESGASMAEVGERFGITRPRVGQLFKQAGLPGRPARPRGAELPPVGELHELYREGASLQELGKRFGTQPARIRKAFVDAGLPVRSHQEAQAMR